MRSRLLCVWSLTAVAGLFPASAPAAEATPEGAAALTSVMQTYLGTTKGVVSVQPGGEAYAVTLDFAPLIAKAPEGVTISVSPLQFNLTDLGDGTWQMQQDQSLTFSAIAPGAAEIVGSVGSLTSEGIFSAELGAFITSTTKISDIALTEKITDAQLGNTDVAYAIRGLSYESTAAAGTAGGVDSKSSFVLEGLTESFTLPGIEMPLSLTAALTTGNSEITGLRPDAFYKLIAFFVANPDQAAIALRQDDLKSILQAGFPLFDHMTSTSTTASVAVDTPMGPAGLANVTIEVEANGVVSDGFVREAIRFDGLTLPAGVVPDWAVDLVPQAVSLDFSLSRFDLAAPAKLLLNMINLATPEVPLTPEQNMALMLALMPEGVVAVTIAPGGIKAPLYEVTYEGALTFGAEQGPDATATITATGMTAVKQALTKAPEEIGMQIAPALGMAEGLAKPGENGVLIWELQATPGGPMMVNGVDMMGMAGGN